MLVTTLTKRMAEDLTEYYQQLGLRVRYLHSDIDTLDRVALIRDLRLGKFDCLIGINLLREGLDIPEVSLVAILDADKVTDSMAATLRETERRRTIQGAYNTEHGITPESIRTSIHELLQTVYERDYYTVEAEPAARETFTSTADLARRVAELEAQMKDAARRLDFEQAAELRDRVRALRKQQVV